MKSSGIKLPEYQGKIKPLSGVMVNLYATMHCRYLLEIIIVIA